MWGGGAHLTPPNRYRAPPSFWRGGQLTLIRAHVASASNVERLGAYEPVCVADVGRTLWISCQKDWFLSRWRRQCGRKGLYLQQCTFQFRLILLPSPPKKRKSDHIWYSFHRRCLGSGPCRFKLASQHGDLRTNCDVTLLFHCSCWWKNSTNTGNWQKPE